MLTSTRGTTESDVADKDTAWDEVGVLAHAKGYELMLMRYRFEDCCVLKFRYADDDISCAVVNELPHGGTPETVNEHFGLPVFSRQQALEWLTMRDKDIAQRL